MVNKGGGPFFQKALVLFTNWDVSMEALMVVSRAHVAVESIPKNQRVLHFSQQLCEACASASRVPPFSMPSAPPPISLCILSRPGGARPTDFAPQQNGGHVVPRVHCS